MVTRNSKPPGLAYQLKVTLLESDPPIWRRLLVPAATRLGELHRILQIAMGWTDSHLHMFTAGGVAYSEPSDEWDLEIKDEGPVRLDQIAREEGEAFVYEYDLGDGWRHQVLFEDLKILDKASPKVSCLGGERACPLEDSGGIDGYYETLEILNDPTHAEHEHIKTWAEGAAAYAGRTAVDPEAFDLAAVNAALSRAGRRRAQR
jgi:hypothetical protein